MMYGSPSAPQRQALCHPALKVLEDLVRGMEQEALGQALSGPVEVAR